jgi:putative transposase
MQVKRDFTGKHFLARGFCVSTVGLDEKKIREYISNQESEEKRQEQMQFSGLIFLLFLLYFHRFQEFLIK